MLNFRLENINDEQSVMMLTAPLHAEFGSFNLTLDLMEAPHTWYKIKLYQNFSGAYRIFLPAGGIVKFTNHDSSHPLSNEILFANILRATGKGEAAEKLLRDKEEISVLAEIGSRYQRYVWTTKDQDWKPKPRC